MKIFLRTVFWTTGVFLLIFACFAPFLIPFTILVSTPVAILLPRELTDTFGAFDTHFFVPNVLGYILFWGVIWLILLTFVLGIVGLFRWIFLAGAGSDPEVPKTTT